ncbi:MAG: M23 family metallopeptidase [Deltaproteobacteria bacterium]|nr:M23 family metallopeptidase [Deltaproteobacteria bacterium]PJB96246.1 MAG: hypothetical protein CO080_03635 [Nitrospirae bacterium CG_4_9_14_0_8_um_filter_70_14]
MRKDSKITGLEFRLQVHRGDGAVRVARLPRPLLIAVAALLPTCVVLVVAAVSLAAQYRGVRAELAAAEAGYQGSRYLYDQLNDELAQVRSLNDRLQVVADNRPPSINSQFFGIGGSSSHPRVKRAPLARRLDDLNRAAGVTAAEVGRQKQGFVELTRLLENRQEEMAAHPSIWPVRGWIASPFGRRVDPYTHRWKLHEGVDIAGRFGTPVVASADGAVASVDRDPAGYGRFVLLNHGATVETLYGHLAQVIVQPGAAVRRGDVIAYMGSSGRSTGPHVHYEVRVAGVHHDPLDYMLD